MSICKRILCLLILSVLLINCSIGIAKERNWVWFYSDDCYSEYINPESVQVVRDYNGNVKHIEVWTKTTYNENEKKSITNNYKMNNVPNILNLSYSLQKIYIKPYSREIVRQNEIFYNNRGEAVWNKEVDESALNWEEVHPMDYEEKCYSYIIDQVYHGGKPINFDISKSGKYDRWVNLSGKDNADGTTTLCFFDKFSIRVNGDEIVYWGIYSTISQDGKKDYFYFKERLDRKLKKTKHIGYYYKNDDGQWKYRESTSNWKSIVPETFSEDDANTIIKYVDQNKIEDIN